MKNFSTIFDYTVTDDDLWDLPTQSFAAVLIGVLLSAAVYVVVAA